MRNARSLFGELAGASVRGFHLLRYVCPATASNNTELHPYFCKDYSGIQKENR